jgi:hypothetical protein
MLKAQEFQSAPYAQLLGTLSQPSSFITVSGLLEKADATNACACAAHCIAVPSHMNIAVLDTLVRKKLFAEAWFQINVNVALDLGLRAWA